MTENNLQHTTLNGDTVLSDSEFGAAIDTGNDVKYVSKKDREEMQTNLIAELDKLKDSDNEEDKRFLELVETEFQKKIDKFSDLAKDMPRKVRRALMPNNRFSARFKKRIGL